MRFEGRVWRFVPKGTHPLNFQHLIRAAGRWNRPGLYGCLYTALSPRGAVAEHRKHERRRGLSRPRDLVALDVVVDPVFDLVEWTEAERKGDFGLPEQERWFQVPPRLALSVILGDTPADLEVCRGLADWARTQGYLALHAPSAAAQNETVLAIYPENVPARLDLKFPNIRYALNYGPDALLDSEGNLRRLLTGL